MPLLLWLITLVHIYFSLDSSAPISDKRTVTMSKCCGWSRCLGMGKGVTSASWELTLPSLLFVTISQHYCLKSHFLWRSEFYTQPVPKGVMFNEPPYLVCYSCSLASTAAFFCFCFLFCFVLFLRKRGVFLGLKENTFINILTGIVLGTTSAWNKKTTGVIRWDRRQTH